MNKITLYQKDQAGNIKVWTAEVVNCSTYAELKTTSGRQNGAIIPTTTIVDKGKGKKTPYEQACSDAQSKIDRKIKEGYVDDKLMMKMDELVEVLQFPEEVAVLVRTNDVIKKFELFLLKRKVPMRYFNYITHTDVKNFNKGEVHNTLKAKLAKLKDYFDNDRDIIHFIERNKNSNKFITTIHKSKGREFETCVVVNSIAPNMLEQYALSKKQLEKISFDPTDEENIEPRNIHYVAVSRSKHKLYFMVWLS